MSRLSCTVACAYTYVHAHGDAETEQAEINHYKNAVCALLSASGSSQAFLGSNDVVRAPSHSLHAYLLRNVCLRNKCRMLHRGSNWVRGVRNVSATHCRLAAGNSELIQQLVKN